ICNRRRNTTLRMKGKTKNDYANAYAIITLNQRNADNMGVWGEFDFFDREMNCYSYHRCSWPAFHFMILPNE
ncbi:MAG: hypothetical protein K6G83_05405, partial [Lachnospiraceae bacterium]|nr:hypothetical protein [Lachnospiraceae bacterium]